MPQPSEPNDLSIQGVRSRLLTPVGQAGVAVVEVRGSGTVVALAQLGVPVRPAGTFSLVHLTTEHGELDEALCWWRSDGSNGNVNPNENDICVELHVHGSAPLIAELLETLGGGRPVATIGGEWLGLERACWNAVETAPCEVAARLALGQAEGALRAELEMVLAELSIESNGKDDKRAFDRLRTLEKRGRMARPWFAPLCVVLQGPVNAGKSTLFNLLVGHDRVITSPTEGTTRDAVHERILLDGLPVDLVDTAGLRAAQVDGLEHRGQELGRQLAAGADLILFLAPPGFDGPIPKGATRLNTQGDLVGAAPDALSALKRPDRAIAEIARLVRGRAQTMDEAPYGQPLPCTEAQRAFLADCVERMQTTVQGTGEGEQNGARARRTVHERLDAILSER